MSYSLEFIAGEARKLGLQLYYCGGTSREKIRGAKLRDIDIEVYGVTYQSLISFLNQYGKADEVGKNFNIVKFRNASFEADFALPRKESKTGSKHSSFQVYSDMFMRKDEACSRRDFTINSILIDILTGEVFDYFGGIQDLKDGVLRATSKAFSQDVLRPLRGMQLCGRFDLKVDPETAQMCRELRPRYSELSLDRIWGEWEKFFLLSIKPSAGLQCLIDTGWSELYPEFHLNINVQQNPKYHKEIFVHTHTMLVCDEAMRIAKEENLSERDTLILMLSALTHDAAKYSHSQGEFPEITSHGHDIAGEPLARSFLTRIGASSYLFDHVPVLVRNHMAHYQCKTEKAVRKLSQRLEPSNIKMLSYLIDADHSGRLMGKGLPTNAVRMLELANTENVIRAKPKRILEGRHLKEIGLTPNSTWGTIIKEAYQKQLGGEIKTLEEGLNWVKQQIKGF